MKTKILAATLLVATSITLASCGWLFGKKQSDIPQLPVQGKWNIADIIDSSISHKNQVGLLALAMSQKDSIPLTVEFLPDSILIVDNDTMHYYLDSTIQTIFVKR